MALEYEANTGDPVSPEKSYYYVTDRGVCQENAQANECVRISGKSLMALHLEDDWNAEIATETKKLLRMVLKMHVGDKPLGSRGTLSSLFTECKRHLILITILPGYM